MQRPNGPTAASRAASSPRARRRGAPRRCARRSRGAAPRRFRASRWSCQFPSLIDENEPSPKHPLERGVNTADQRLGAKLLGDVAGLLKEFSCRRELSLQLAQQLEIGKALRQKTRRIGLAGITDRLLEMLACADFGLR